MTNQKIVFKEVEMKTVEELAKEYNAIFKEIENIIDFSDDYDDDLVEHMERCAIDLEDDLTPSQREKFYKLINN